MRNKFEIESIAKSRIKKLLDLASCESDTSLSKRYVDLSRKIAMRAQVKFTRDQKRLFCKSCSSFFRPGINSKFRLNKGILVIRCLSCNSIKRLKYKK